MKRKGWDTVPVGTILRWNLAVDFERVSLIAQFFFTQLSELAEDAERAIIGIERC